MPTTRVFRSICALALCTGAAFSTTASAQVNPVTGYPNNHLSVSVGWSGALLQNTAYGAGFGNAASFGTISNARGVAEIGRAHV